MCLMRCSPFCRVPTVKGKASVATPSRLGGGWHSSITTPLLFTESYILSHQRAYPGSHSVSGGEHAPQTPQLSPSLISTTQFSLAHWNNGAFCINKWENMLSQFVAAKLEFLQKSQQGHWIWKLYKRQKQNQFSEKSLP